ncbi:hypothetical protein [uncultured Methylobacterium sp.]|jgi:hypothetical protein|uniref:DUF6894 family protein n=1 Tax=uncultured Methylobacterium sp. TaxID=157278 RepID=UPI0026335A8D|nr:hypothetical protein [uncultured Methylobacterium sp.]
MPRYFFDIFDGNGRQSDDTGTEFADLDDVRKAAMQLLPNIAREEIPKDGDRCSLVVLVTDEDGHPVYSATLTYTGLWLLR